uniref:Orf71 n=1 Tax=Ancoracysta twista TaxID=2044563 RepID=A0A2H4R8E8_9EUKA|nr:orf71 [Ancoracysta twista]ATY40924.1 orf71 [Ancoracysta twista]
MFKFIRIKVLSIIKKNKDFNCNLFLRIKLDSRPKLTQFRPLILSSSTSGFFILRGVIYFIMYYELSCAFLG